MPASKQNDPLIGSLLAERYRILSVIGQGGMGLVYQARHEYMDRLVAVKMLQPQLVQDSTSVKRFEREAQAASRLNHPNIITLHDYGTRDGVPYLIMDYIRGTSLSELIKREGKVGVLRSINIFAQICDALEHAHRQHIVHRDLKPGNIMLVESESQQDFVKVVDFGVAKITNFAGDDAQRMTATGEIFGSPVYLSPEQCDGRRIDHRSDIYSMGVVMYETLTGKLPLSGKTIVETIQKHMNEKPAPFNKIRPDLYFPEALESAVLKALEKQPEKRHQSMLELKEELLASSPRRRGVSQSMSGLTPLSMEAQPPAASPQRKPGGARVAAIVATVVLVAAAFLALAFNLPRPHGSEHGTPAGAAGGDRQPPSREPISTERSQQAGGQEQAGQERMSQQAAGPNRNEGNNRRAAATSKSSTFARTAGFSAGSNDSLTADGKPQANSSIRTPGTGASAAASKNKVKDRQFIRRSPTAAVPASQPAPSLPRPGRFRDDSAIIYDFNTRHGGSHSAAHDFPVAGSKRGD